MLCQEIRCVCAGGSEARDVVIDEGTRKCSKELDENAMRPRRSRCDRIERRVLFEYFPLLFGRQNSTADVVVVTRAPHVHHHGAARTEGISQGEMYLIGATRNLADAPHGRVKHHNVAFGNAERPEVAREFSSRPHRCLLFALCSLLLLSASSIVKGDERDRSLFGEAAREDVGAREAIEIARNRKAEVIENRRSDVDD